MGKHTLLSISAVLSKLKDFSRLQAVVYSKNNISEMVLDREVVTTDH